jgi:cyanophycin synthetase
VRLIAACARMHGWRAGYNCTDGVFVDTVALATGDYSGPAGARMVMRDSRAQAAIIETARGGILRRGLAVSRADAAVITNVSADHFGEYGIDDLAGLAQTKLSVAAALTSHGTLVLNADDAQLREQANRLAHRFGQSPPVAWFSLDTEPRILREYRLQGSSVCGVQGGRLQLSIGSADHDLGLIASMPLSMQGIATYNVANLAGAALAAAALGIAPTTIAAVFARFGSDLHDNPGRMMQFEVGGVRVLIDYAHNPDGMRGFLKVAAHLRGGSGRLGLMLGQAGNRSNADIEELAQIAAECRPDLIVVKENVDQLRGRAPGEVPAIIRAELMRGGLSPAALPLAANELDAADIALHWARPGDVLALPLHSRAAREQLITRLSNRIRQS